MATLDKYLKKWDLAAPELLAQTPTSAIYTVTAAGKRAVLKLLTPMGIQDEASGAAALQHFDGHGAVRLLNSDAGAHLMEYAEGDDLAGMVACGDDEAATVIIADVLTQLHAKDVPTPPDGLTPLRSRFRPLFQKAEADKQVGDESLFVRGAVIAEKLLSTSREERVLHGDVHHNNIRYSAGRGWLSFDPKGLYGERTYDTANIFHNPYPSDVPVDERRILRTADLLAEKLQIDVRRILAYAFAYTCLTAIRFLEDDAVDGSRTFRIAALIEPHIDRIF